MNGVYKTHKYFLKNGTIADRLGFHDKLAGRDPKIRTAGSFYLRAIR